ncbi:MAG: hypothetical protein GX638_00020, partial [Crenarchaeota archaeon]|nr:hypothetical protein [Thermoproteota archaeon]
GAAIVCDKSRIYIDGELDIHANREQGSFGYGIWAENDSSIISNYETINFYNCTIAVFGDTLSRVFIGSMSGTGTSTVAMKAGKGSFVGTGGIEVDTFTTYTQTDWTGIIINEINTSDYDA